MTRYWFLFLCGSKQQARGGEGVPPGCPGEGMLMRRVSALGCWSGLGPCFDVTSEPSNCPGVAPAQVDRVREVTRLAESPQSCAGQAGNSHDRGHPQHLRQPTCWVRFTVDGTTPPPGRAVRTESIVFYALHHATNSQQERSQTVRSVRSSVRKPFVCPLTWGNTDPQPANVRSRSPRGFPVTSRINKTTTPLMEDSRTHPRRAGAAPGRR